MLIHRIELTNFKSFDSTVIDMAPGLTAIVGDNGAGKTAILQAIGLAVFDDRPHPLATVMRHGAADAEVSVEFTSGLDERRYRVTRRLHRTRDRGTGALSPNVQMESSVLDVEQGSVFAERADDLNDFLVEHLGVIGFSGPDAVFAHVVGRAAGSADRGLSGSAGCAPRALRSHPARRRVQAGRRRPAAGCSTTSTSSASPMNRRPASWGSSWSAGPPLNPRWPKRSVRPGRSPGAASMRRPSWTRPKLPLSDTTRRPKPPRLP